MQTLTVEQALKLAMAECDTTECEWQTIKPVVYKLVKVRDKWMDWRRGNG